ncbi:3-mercaptopyruvate sulfurtransferase [Abyssibius alkaniclasticus]|uniref:3-mercaptopyruvate sulfurtransferase n=1 Tax=Abyssibius alkaniclasticus TaxID=2881234 RepID=UPI0023643F3D|nr:3-mercaptopyruvate sulfurtransferase [Abyssibius alkaniclasticus]UPH72459.1 3-mercaptopyruvate sulfurtransferase [Abyssibius alkaniclasticus]|tara:strand:- start:272 stop:1126 length:855 start_codon:yes stop_codon:yes gene_type:complete
MAWSPQPLVSTAWLADHLTAPDLRIIDASWYMPADNRDVRAEYDKCHIPGARFFDIDEISDAQSDLPHMAPSVEKFVSRMRALGIGDGHRVVVYDSAGIFSAARVWWLFNHFGKTDVSVLDGGLPAWIAERRDTLDFPPTLRDRHFTARRNADLVRDVTQVAASAKLRDVQIVDARAPARFEGTAPEPREGLRSGHIPGARNLFFKDLLTADGKMKDKDGLRAAFAAAGVDLDRPIVTSCGSGVTAAIINLALVVLGHSNHALYDGSWAEWGAYKDLKVATGPA